MPRLRRSDPAAAGIRRVKAGRGFFYRHPTGETVVDGDLRSRIDSLVIPPAWTDVWISPHENGHIQATGVDSVGRRQYIYHERWRLQRDRTKFDRAISLARALPAARRKVTMDLRSAGQSRQRTLAAAFRMLDTGALRVGSERYAEENGSHGLATLLCAHVDVRGDSIHLDFPSKSGKTWSSTISDPDLAAALRALSKREAAARLLSYRGDDGEWHPIAAWEINDYVRDRTGGAFTAKDFRTLRGTTAAAISLALAGRPSSRRAASRAIATAMSEAAMVLGNTPSIARKSYVDPRLVARYLAGRTINPQRLSSAESELVELLA
jgi:DNA topoisomerase-1